MIDCLIQHGHIIDGSGKPAFAANVVIDKGKILEISTNQDIPARKTIDAKGMTVTPGFIDMHSHSDLLFVNGSRIEHKIRQGITTELIGQDGISAAPVAESSMQTMASIIEPLAGPLETPWQPWDTENFLAAVNSKKPSLNVMTLTGHCNLRVATMGQQMSLASSHQLADMRFLLAENLRQGSVGLSLGLIYAPSSYSNTEELISLAEIVSDHNGIIVSHIRDEKDGILQALDEMITIGQQTGAHIHISHLKCLGKRNWGRMNEVLDRFDRAVADGVCISFDQYPYDASSTTLSLLLPDSALDGGWQGFHTRLTDETYKGKLIESIKKAIEQRGGAEAIMIASAPGEKTEHFSGKSLASISNAIGSSSAETALEIICQTKLCAIAIYHAISPDDVERALIHSLHTVGSDGVLGAFPHPRAFGTFPRIINEYCHNKHLLSLETAIQDMTSKSADILRLSDRGMVKKGYWADLLLFQPEHFIDHATYNNPSLAATGLEWVFINGEVVVENGQLQDCRPGIVLRH
jgi:N-acyl-D-amino-acid deacylase